MSLLVSPQDVAVANAEVQRLMGDTLQVVRRTSTPDGFGGQTVTWVLQAPTYSCYVEPYISRQGGEENEQLGAISNADAGWRITVPTGTPIAITDRALVNGTRAFEVLTLDAPKTFGIGMRLYCVERFD